MESGQGIEYEVFISGAWQPVIYAGVTEENHLRFRTSASASIRQVPPSLWRRLFPAGYEPLITRRRPRIPLPPVEEEPQHVRTPPEAFPSA